MPAIRTHQYTIGRVLARVAESRSNGLGTILGVIAMAKQKGPKADTENEEYNV